MGDSPGPGVKWHPGPGTRRSPRAQRSALPPVTPRRQPRCHAGTCTRRLISGDRAPGPRLRAATAPSSKVTAHSSPLRSWEFRRLRLMDDAVTGMSLYKSLFAFVLKRGFIGSETLAMSPPDGPWGRPPIPVTPLPRGREHAGGRPPESGRTPAAGRAHRLGHHRARPPPSWVTSGKALPLSGPWRPYRRGQCAFQGRGFAGGTFRPDGRDHATLQGLGGRELMGDAVPGPGCLRAQLCLTATRP